MRKPTRLVNPFWKKQTLLRFASPTLQEDPAAEASTCFTCKNLALARITSWDCLWAWVTLTFSRTRRSKRAQDPSFKEQVAWLIASKDAQMPKDTAEGWKAQSNRQSWDFVRIISYTSSTRRTSGIGKRFDESVWERFVAYLELKNLENPSKTVLEFCSLSYSVLLSISSQCNNFCRINGSSEFFLYPRLCAEELLWDARINKKGARLLQITWSEVWWSFVIP